MERKYIIGELFRYKKAGKRELPFGALGICKEADEKGKNLLIDWGEFGTVWVTEKEVMLDNDWEF